MMGLLTVAAPIRLEAQRAGATYRIGVLVPEQAADLANIAAFRQGLSELGYVEGQNLVIEYRSAEGRVERLTDLARELARIKIDVIVTRGTQAALAAKEATATIPIVMATSWGPTVSGLVASHARPGSNITGFHVMAPPELGGMRLELLREAVPGVSRIGILWNPSDLYSPPFVKDTARLAAAKGVALKSLEVQRPEGFDQAFEAALLAQIEALIVVEDFLMVVDRARIVTFAAMSRLPAIYGIREFVDDGGLMSYGTDQRNLFRRCATYVHRILNGTRPADLPVERPIKFELAANLQTANALGLTMPPLLLERADHVIK
jgi:putative ABC transport system substrate-binding protein